LPLFFKASVSVIRIRKSRSDLQHQTAGQRQSGHLSLGSPIS
jgi:hypothetical protein